MRNPNFLGISIDRVEMAIYHNIKLNKDKFKFQRKLFDTFKYHPGNKIVRFKNHNGKWSFYLNEEIIRDPKIDDGRGLAWLKINLDYPYGAIAYFNPHLLWRYDNKNYDLAGLIHNNYLPIEAKRAETFKVYIKYRDKLIERVKNHWIEKFGIKQSLAATSFRVYEAEICEEYKGHVSNYSHNFDSVRGQVRGKFTNATQTYYVNKLQNGKQLKMYQKAPNLARVEWTFHNEDAEKMMGFDLNEHLYRSVDKSLHQAKTEVNYGRFTTKKTKPNVFLHETAIALKIPVEEVEILINATQIDSKSFNKNRLRAFVNRRIIERVKQGVYVPTVWWLHMQEMFLEIKNKVIICLGWKKEHDKGHGRAICYLEKYHEEPHQYLCRVCDQETTEEK